MNHQKKLILFCSLALIITMSSLAWTERKQSDYADGKDWWAISFIDPSPTNDSMNFVIENFADNHEFSYEITDQNTTSDPKIINIPKGSSRQISIPQVAPAEVTVTLGKQTKTLNK